MKISATHLVLIPTYNTGDRLAITVREALVRWRPVWVIVDGSSDDSYRVVEEMAATEVGLRVIILGRNSGKGGAVLAGVQAALADGFTHALVMDADGQHPADRIVDFMQASQAKPSAMVLGCPIFGPEAPQIRLQGRKLSVYLVHFETFGKTIEDPLFGFRVYPLKPLARVFAGTHWARRYDFDPEVAVRLVWHGLTTTNLPTQCRYLSREEGGVSHFHYCRDNLRMIWLHTRLLIELLLFRWIVLLRNRATSSK